MTGLITHGRGAGVIAGAEGGADRACGLGALGAACAGAASRLAQMARSSSDITGLITHVLGEGAMPSAAGAAATAGAAAAGLGAGCAELASRLAQMARSSSDITGLITQVLWAGARPGAVLATAAAGAGAWGFSTVVRARGSRWAQFARSCSDITGLTTHGPAGLSIGAGGGVGTAAVARGGAMAACRVGAGAAGFATRGSLGSTMLRAA